MDFRISRTDNAYNSPYTMSFSLRLLDSFLSGFASIFSSVVSPGSNLHGLDVFDTFVQLLSMQNMRKIGWKNMDFYLFIFFKCA